MTMRASIVAILTLAGAAVLVTGCAGTFASPRSSNLPAVTNNAFGAPDIDRGLLFAVEQPPFGDVVVYRQKGQNQQPFRYINQDLINPAALWVDTFDNLWVGNEGAVSSGPKSTIMRFPRLGTQAPDRILDDFNWFPDALWVSRDGNVYVGNDPVGATEKAEVVEYPPQSKTYKVIGDPNISYTVTAIVGDAKGDLFAAGYTDSHVGEIDELPAGSKHWSDTGIAGKGRSVSQPLSLAFDADSNLVVDDYGRKLIETFKPGQTKPSNAIKCTPLDCAVIAFSHMGSRLWVGEPSYFTGTIAEFEYPSGKLIETLTLGYASSAYALATSPDLYP
jgi:DNA-binding beta-propeller fold protein YncE